MYTLPDHFDKFLTNIQPRENRSVLAQTIPEFVRDYLKGTDLLKTVAPQSRLAGSYGRRTAIKNIKDVDTLVFINPDYKTGKDREPINVLNDLVDALQDLPKYLGDYEGTIDADLAIRRQRRSVHVTFTLSSGNGQVDEAFEMDVVPVVALDGLDKSLWVPDWDWSKWIETDPLGYGGYLSAINKVNCGKVKPLIKMLKHWRDVRMIYLRPKSYWLECMIVGLIEGEKLFFKDMSYAEIFSNLLGAIFERYEEDFQKESAVPKILDPMLSNNVAWNWERKDFETFIRRVDESSRWAKRALECENEADAIALWQKVFNRDGEDEYFPTTVDDAAKAIAAARNAGTLRVTPTGTLLTNVAVGIHSVQSPPHQFYGKK
jgi:hypothetical protein